jgi:hypothetical protein
MRLLDWTTVSIALLVLLANRLSTTSDPVLADQVPDAPSPFAYIREDGSLVYVPNSGSNSGPGEAAQALTDTVAATGAIYTWSLPMVTPRADTASSR